MVEIAPAEGRVQNFRRFTFYLTIVAVFLSAIPTIIGLIGLPPSKLYLGVQYAADDHMVYAAWMRQAMEGHLLFDNRFTQLAQPGLTFHLYFLLLGFLAKIVTIPVATNLARLFFTYLFVQLLAKLVAKLDVCLYASKLAMVLGVFGGGFGYLGWAAFGRTSDSGPFHTLLQGRLATDVWQPEAFTFPSMLTNGLFMVSLCLILGIILCLIGAKDSWKSAGWGALQMAILMNIHSYDALIVAMVFATYGLLLLANRQLGWKWLIRAIVIGAGAIPPAIYYLYVISQDPVFAARAETPTFSPTFRQMFVGLLPLLILFCFKVGSSEFNVKRKIGLGVWLLGLISLIVLSGGANPDTAFLTLPTWIGFAGLFILAAYLLSTTDLIENLFLSWGMIGLILPYFPEPYQRKLAMGLSIPWGILAAIGFAKVATKQERNLRNLVTALVILAASGSSLFWLQREILYIRNDVSSTTVQPIYYPQDVRKIIEKLNEIPGRKVVVAMPGVPLPAEGDFAFTSPYLPDLNPVLSGMAGVYTVAGHWSETPNYQDMRGLVTAFFIGDMSDEERQELAADLEIDYIIKPNAEVYDQIPLKELGSFTELIYSGRQFNLYRVLE